MPATKLWSFANLDAAIERVAPDVLTLLADGVPRPEAAIVTALAGRRLKQDVTLTVMRLAVTEQLWSRSVAGTPCRSRPIRPLPKAGFSRAVAAQS
jgi:hypothetical protein